MHLHSHHDGMEIDSKSVKMDILATLKLFAITKHTYTL